MKSLGMTAAVALSSLLPAGAPAGPDETAKGEIVADIGASCWVVFQDASNHYWFGSDGNGLYRYDGKTLTRFTTKDGLAHDAIRGIQQHVSTGHLLICTNGGVSKFDGERFVTLPMTEMGAPGDSDAQGWRLDPDDLWIQGRSGPKGPCRYDGKTLQALQFPKSPRADAYFRDHSDRPWNPYGVWSVYRDRSGHMWFGTAMFGVCRFDGRTWEWMYEAHLQEVPNGGMFGLRSIIEDEDGAFWFCNTSYRYRFTPSASAGVDAWKSGGELEYTRDPGIDPAALPPGESPIYFQSVVDDPTADLWLATYGYGVWRSDGEQMTHYPIMDGDRVVTLVSIYRDRHDGLWLGTHEHGAYRFNGETFERFRPSGPEARR